MAVKRPVGAMPDTYFALVREFPLAHIRNDDHLEAAQIMLDRLTAERLDSGGRQYLDVLTDLVEAYEDDRVIMPEASEADVLAELMRAGGVSQNKLAAAVGIAQSTISAVLNGSRSLTKAQVVKLADHFGVSPAAFLTG
jgi:HTH-type transcriptional regulator / antitoxin HigA